MDALNSVFKLLSKERRRYVLYYLERKDGPVSVSELTDKILEWERNSSRSPTSEEDHEEIKITLQHNHLPKAAEAEFIEYHPEQNTIEITGAPAEFKVILSVAEAIEQPDREDIVTLTG